MNAVRGGPVGAIPDWGRPDSQQPREERGRKERTATSKAAEARTRHVARPLAGRERRHRIAATLLDRHGLSHGGHRDGHVAGLGPLRGQEHAIQPQHLGDWRRVPWRTSASSWSAWVRVPLRWYEPVLWRVRPFFPSGRVGRRRPCRSLRPAPVPGNASAVSRYSAVSVHSMPSRTPPAGSAGNRRRSRPVSSSGSVPLLVGGERARGPRSS